MSIYFLFKERINQSVKRKQFFIRTRRSYGTTFNLLGFEDQFFKYLPVRPVRCANKSY